MHDSKSKSSRACKSMHFEDYEIFFINASIVLQYEFVYFECGIPISDSFWSLVGVGVFEFVFSIKNVKFLEYMQIWNKLCFKYITNIV